MKRSDIHLIALAAYALICLATTYPMVARMGWVVDFVDSRFFLWSLWWWKHSLIYIHANPLYTHSLCCPDGVSILYQNSMPAIGIASIPLQLLFGTEAAFNILALLSFPLCGYFMFLLCRNLCTDDLASFFGGLVFAFSSVRFQWASMGWLNLLSCFWIPLFALYVMKSLRGGRRNDAILAGFFCALSGLTHLEFLVFEAFFTAIFIIYLLFAEGWLKRSRTLIRPMVTVPVVAFILSSPVLVPTLLEYPQYKVQQAGMEELKGNSMDAAGLLLPPPSNPFFGGFTKGAYARIEDKFGTTIVRVGYLGVVPLLLSAVGLALRPRRESLFWIALAIFFSILSLGPVVLYMGDETSVRTFYGTLLDIPFFSMTRHVARFILMTSLAIAVLSSFGLAGLGRKMAPASRIVLVVLLASLYLAESAIPIRMSAPFDAGTAPSSVDVDKGCVLFSPVADSDAFKVSEDWGTSLSNCKLQRESARFMGDSRKRQLIDLTRRISDPKGLRTFGAKQAEADLDGLRSRGIAYLVAKKAPYRNDTSSLEAYMALMNVSVVGEDAQTIVFLVPDQPSR